MRRIATLAAGAGALMVMSSGAYALCPPPAGGPLVGAAAGAASGAVGTIDAAEAPPCIYVIEEEIPPAEPRAGSIVLLRGMDKGDREMDWDRIEGNWKQAKGKVKEQWGKLTDDDLDVVAGKRDQLEGKIQERYGIAKDQVRKDVDNWVNTQRW